jgi:hypothetical protein
MAITYTPAKNDKNEVVHWVHLDRRIVGLIQRGKLGYFYKPKGSKDIGDTFPPLKACKRSLETDLA